MMTRSCEMSEKRLSQKLLTVEDVEKSGFYFWEEPYEMRIWLVFPKKNPLFSMASTVKGSCDRCLSRIPQS